jgi:integrase
MPGVAVYARGKTWAYQVEADRHPLDGHRQRSYKGGFATEQVAWVAAVDAKKRLDAGRAPHAKKMHLHDFLEEWLETARPALKATSYASYRDLAEDYIYPTLGKRWLGEISVQVLNGFYRHLSESGRKKEDTNGRMYEYWSARREERRGLGPRPLQVAAACSVSRDAARAALMRYRRGRAAAPKPAGLSPKSVRNIHGLLHRALNDAVAWGYLFGNPAHHAVLPRAKVTNSNAVQVPWTIEELGRWLTFALEDRYSGLWALAATTGMRRSELAGIRRDLLDLDTELLVVADTRVVVDGRAEDSDGKTAAGRRTLSLDSFTVKHLRAYVGLIESERETLGNSYPDHGYLAVRPDGARLHPDTLTRRFNRIVDRAGVRRIRLHDVRHTYATLAKVRGVDPKMLSDRMGHANTAITLQTYTHHSTGKDRDLVRSVSEVIEKALDLAGSQ